MSKFLRLALVVFTLALVSISAMAQSTTDGAIGGTIKDPNGAVVPNAAINIKNEETNREATATSDSEGRFNVVHLQPGQYSIIVNASGFGAFTQSKIVVEVGRTTSLDIPLSVGAVSGEQVNVTGEAPVINTTQQDFSTNINQTSINELPINGRRWSNFALLTPGAVPDGNFGLVSFRGVSGLLNNNTVDGGDNNQAFFSEERGRTRISYVISQASIREFQVNTSNYSAEYGRAAGGVVNAVTKSGTNEFHGSAFFYDRDNKLGTRNPRGFVPVLLPGNIVDQAPVKPLDKRYQFGGSIGGPIVKDHLFFFFSYDEQRRNFPGIAIPSTANFFTTVNTANLTAPARGLTVAQINSATGFLQSLLGEVPRKGNQRIFLPKIDWNINSSNSLAVTFNRMRWFSPAGVQTQPTVSNGRASFGNDGVRVDTLNVRLISTIKPTLLNEARFQYGRDFEFQSSQAPAPGEPLSGPNGRPPQIAITGGFTFGKANFLERVRYPDEKRWQYADTITWTSGQHTFKFGFDINHVNDVLSNLFTEEGSYSYANINDFIVDYVNFTSGGALRAAGRVCSTSARLAGQCYNNNYQQGFGPQTFRFSTNDFNFFIQDDYRVSSKLTLNLGLRYEYEQMPNPQIPNALNNLAGQFVGPEQTRSFAKDKNNIGPRIGFAYDINGDGKFSVRGGYGIYYGRIINSSISNAITNTGTTTSQRTFSINPATTPAASLPIFPTTLTAPPVGGTVTPNIVVFSRNLASPQIHQADLVIERQISHNTVVSASFLVSLGRRLPTYLDRNLNQPGQRTFTFSGGPRNGQQVTVPFFFTPRPDTRFGAITEIASVIKSEYEAMVLQANRRLSKGLQFQINYTWSRATDNGQSSQTFTATNAPLNPFDLSLDRGRTSFDVPHKFTASAVWTPTPFREDQKVGRALFNGFSIAPIVIAASGPPYSATTSGNPSLGVSGSITGSGSFATGGNFTYLPFLGRNSFRQPSIVNVDLRVSRRFHIKEDMSLEILAEGFNILNRTQFTSVNTRLYSISGTTLTFDPTFGTLASAGNTLVRERQIQFALRFEF